MPVPLRNRYGTFIEISRNDQEKWIYAHWKGQLSVDDVMAGANAVLVEIRETGYTKLLNNNKELIGHWNEANEWIATE